MDSQYNGIPLSRQLPEFCSRRIAMEEVRDEWGAVFWKVTVDGVSAELCFDEMLAFIALYTRPHKLSKHLPIYWSCFKLDEARRDDDRIRDSHWKLRHLGCLKESELDVW